MRGRTVFISYRHDPNYADSEVREIADIMRELGINVLFDQYIENPGEGWPRWCETGIERSKNVLMVCTKDYLARFGGLGKKKKGLGTKFEGYVITSEFYRLQTRTSKFIPMLLHKHDQRYVPDLFNSHSAYDVSNDKMLARLILRLKGNIRGTQKAKSSAEIDPLVLQIQGLRRGEQMRSKAMRKVKPATVIHLRRRCLSIPPTLIEVKGWAKALLKSKRVSKSESRTTNVGDPTNEHLLRAFEALVMGENELVLQEIQKHSYSGLEGYRRLYVALALEKLDKPSKALEELNWILRRNRDDRDLAVCAQFNSLVCLEKMGRIEDADFAGFLSDKKLALRTGEKVWPKALSMTLIACTKTQTRFLDKHLVPQCLKEEKALDPQGYVKTLINWLNYCGDELKKDQLAFILQMVPKLSPTAKAATYRALLNSKTVARDAGLKDRLVQLLEQLVERNSDRSVAKFITKYRSRRK